MADSDPLPGETSATVTDTDRADQVRQVIANVYTFVRSREINKTIASFTFDHYIDEAKRSIKGDRIIRSASDPGQGLGVRPSRLDSIVKLEEDFNNTFDTAKKVAERSEKKNSS